MSIVFDEFADPFNSLDEVRVQKRPEYRGATPVQHCCIDGLINEDLLEKVYREFPSPEGIDWNLRERGTYSHKKLITKDVDSQMGPYTRYLVSALNSPRFLTFLEDVTGVSGLLPDPYMHAGGLHQIEAGGFLEMHTDFNWSTKLNLFRRLNVILYLNKDWKEEYNGALELWDENMQQRAKYYPFWNRIAVVSVTSTALHGFPDPIKCPEGETRKSLAAWYYTVDLPLSEQLGYDLRSPNFLQRDGKGGPLEVTTLRRLLPPILYAFKRGARHTQAVTANQMARVFTRFTPPILLQAIQKLKGRSAA